MLAFPSTKHHISKCSLHFDKLKGSQGKSQLQHNPNLIEQYATIPCSRVPDYAKQINVAKYSITIHMITSQRKRAIEPVVTSPEPVALS